MTGSALLDTADAADHIPAAQAIAKGAIEGHSPDRPVYWLHTSGAGIFSSFDEEDGTYGERSEAIYDDVKDIQAIISLPDDAMDRDVDKTVFATGADSPDVLKVAIISPTTVYGMSSRHGNLKLHGTNHVNRGRQRPLLSPESTIIRDGEVHIGSKEGPSHWSGSRHRIQYSCL